MKVTLILLFALRITTASDLEGLPPTFLQMERKRTWTWSWWGAAAIAHRSLPKQMRWRAARVATCYCTFGTRVVCAVEPFAAETVFFALVPERSSAAGFQLAYPRLLLRAGLTRVARPPRIDPGRRGYITLQQFMSVRIRIIVLYSKYI
jgi:hypothetical protein